MKSALARSYVFEGGKIVVKYTQTVDLCEVASNPMFVRTGYTLHGFSFSNDGSAKYVVDGQTELEVTGEQLIKDAGVSAPYAAQEVTLYAVWSANTYKVSYVYGNETKGQAEVKYGETFTVAGNDLFTRHGYYYTEWKNVDDEADKYAVNGQKVMGASDLELTPDWQKDSFTISFNANKPVTEGSIVGDMPENLTAYFDTAITLTAVESTLTGYTFAGWNTSANGQGVSIADAQTVDVSTINNLYASYRTEEVVTLYAIWTPIEYTLRVYSNAPEGYTASAEYKEVTIKYDQEYVLDNGSEEIGFVIPGFEFKGYALTPEATVANVVSPIKNARSTPGEHSIYIVWEASGDVAYDVEYYKENLDGGFDVETDNLFGYTGQNITATIKTFAGFTYDEGNALNVKNGVVDAVNKLVLKLYYTRNVNTLTFNTNEGLKSGTITGDINEDGTINNKTGIKSFDEIDSLPVINKAGYDFLGWFTEIDGGVKVEVGSEYTWVVLGQTTSTKVLYAHWEARTDTEYKVYHFLQKLDGTYPTELEDEFIEVIKGKTDEQIDIDAIINNTYAGYTFAYSIPPTLGLIGGDGDYTVELYYTLNNVVVTIEKESGIASYNVNSNSAISNEGDEYTVKYGATVTLSAQCNSGYTVKGFYIGGSELVDASTVVYADTTINIKHKVNIYNIH